MSITLNLDDATTVELERAAQASGVSLSQLITQLVKQRCVAPTTAPPREASAPPPLPPPHAMGSLVDLNKANELADRLEDEARIEALRMTG
ncbi:hypothetical protein LBMAG56_34720 [Verrucomicrobiota bacterium]|nr:hypothetical protein LBMAG56_34720 [Verrucomicrobiota bacterium]